jgi:hypothetical protein
MECGQFKSMNDRIRSPYSHAPHIRLRPVLPQLSMNLHLRSKFAFSAYRSMVAVSSGNVNLFSRPSPARKSQAKNAVLFQQTILRYFVHFWQHEKATR